MPDQMEVCENESSDNTKAVERRLHGQMNAQVRSDYAKAEHMLAGTG